MLAWLYLGSEWIIRIGMIPIVLRRRRPESALAWLTTIFFIPWIGLSAYVVFGRQRLGRRHVAQIREAVRVVRRTRRSGIEGESPARSGVPARHHDLIALAELVGAMPTRKGNHVEMISNSEAMVRRLIADIDEAKHHVHIDMYIYADDETGARVNQALARAVSRGVHCRLLVDAHGSRAFLAGSAGTLRRAGVEIYPQLSVSPFRLLLERIDVRNHRKLAVIDGRVGYVGSQNIVNPDYGSGHFGPWRDLTVRVTGPGVHQLQVVFMEDWYAERRVILSGDDLFPAPDQGGAVTIQIVPSGAAFEADALKDLIVAAIHEAEKRIIITTPYFIPGETALAALRIAVRRGVRVDLVVPERANHPIVSAAGRSYLRELARAGANVYLHQSGLLHAKTITVDDALAVIGSSNFDIRSFDLNLELNLLLFGKQVSLDVLEQQELYIGESKAILRPDRPSRWGGLAEDAARLFSPLL
ncbi:MAG: cardiolipin synthase [Phycisphaerae bacterium]|nr:cardiolipin synthase [Phycisphaerae bacterium]